MTYKDKTFCASKGPHTCGRELTEADYKYLEKNSYISVAMSYFCEFEASPEEKSYIPEVLQQ